MDKKTAERILKTWSEGPVDARVLVLAAHPDDDIIGVGGSLGRVREAAVVYLTRGEGGAARRGMSAEEYGSLRAAEAYSALYSTGANVSTPHFLGGRDGHTVEQLEPLSRELLRILRAFGPDIVVTHSYEGGHPDHDAARFVAEAAIELLRRENFSSIVPRYPGLFEFSSYHRAADGGMATGEFIEGEGGARGEAAGTIMRLTMQEQLRRIAALGQHKSQASILRNFLTAHEVLRLAQPVDFQVPPQTPLFYESVSWGRWAGWSGAFSRARMADAERALFPHPIALPPTWWQ